MLQHRHPHRCEVAGYMRLPCYRCRTDSNTEIDRTKVRNGSHPLDQDIVMYV